MARVTVEDCIDKVENRFELVMMASQRARQIGTGAAPTVERDNDKKTVISLREIAGETVSVEKLKEEIITSYQRYLPADSEDDQIDLMDGEQEWGEMAEGEATAAAPTGMYADEEAVDDASSPSLGDIAGA